MLNPDVIERLRALATSNYDVRDLLAENERLQDALSSRPSMMVDPTGGISDDERIERRNAAYQP